MTSIIRLRDVCPTYNEACIRYAAALAKSDNGAAEETFQEMRRIARAYWDGVEHGRHLPEAAE